MTVSLWNRHRDAEVVHCDVAVIGSGICGISMAIELERRGLGVIVLDQGSFGSGASTRNAGYLMRGTADSYARAVTLHGRELTRTMWRWTEENLQIIRGRVPTTLIESVPSALAGKTEQELSDLDLSRDMLREDGFEVEWLESGDDCLWQHGSVVAALVNPRDARANSRLLLDSMRGHFEGRCIEHAEVYDVEPAEKYLTVWAEGVRVECSKVVHCTNAWLNSHRVSADIPVEPNRAQMLAFRSRDVRLNYSYYLRNGADYIRTYGDGLVLVGGCRKLHEVEERTLLDQTSTALQADLERTAMRDLGLDSVDVVARWSGVMAFTPDGLPVIGPVDNEHRIWVVGGFNGHGMGLAARCAQAATESMLDGVPTPIPLSRFARNTSNKG